MSDESNCWGAWFDGLGDALRTPSIQRERQILYSAPIGPDPTEHLTAIHIETPILPYSIDWEDE